jgi:hypothetical protein
VIYFLESSQCVCCQFVWLWFATALHESNEMHNVAKEEDFVFKNNQATTNSWGPRRTSKVAVPDWLPRSCSPGTIRSTGQFVSIHLVTFIFTSFTSCISVSILSNCQAMVNNGRSNGCRACKRRKTKVSCSSIHESHSDSSSAKNLSLLSQVSESRQSSSWISRSVSI